MGQLGFWRRAQENPDWIVVIEADGTRVHRGEPAGPGQPADPRAARLGLGRGTASPARRRTCRARWRSTWPRSRPAGITPRSTGTSPLRRSPTSCVTARRRRSSCTSGSAAAGARPPPTRREFRPPGGQLRRTCPGSRRCTVYARACQRPCRPTAPRAPPCTTRRARPAARRACAGRCPGLDPDVAAELATALPQFFGITSARRTCTWSRRRNYHTAVTVFGCGAAAMGHTWSAWTRGTPSRRSRLCSVTG